MHKMSTSKNRAISCDKFIIKYFLHLCELVEKLNWANFLELSMVMTLSSRKFHHLCIYTVEIWLSRLQTKYLKVYHMIGFFSAAGWLAFLLLLSCILRMLVWVVRRGNLKKHFSFKYFRKISFSLQTVKITSAVIFPFPMQKHSR